MVGKQTRLPFKRYEKTTTRCLELIHSEVCGTVNPTALNRSKYFVIFVDDFSHFTQLPLIKHKSVVFYYFLKYQAQVENFYKKTNTFGTKHDQNGVDNTSPSHQEKQFAFKHPVITRIWFG